MRLGLPAIAALLVLAGCDGGQQAAPSNDNAQVAVETNEPSASSDTNIAAANASLAEPDGPIDPASAEAAGQVVQHYGALIEQKRWAEANALWGDSAAAKMFAAQLVQYSEAHLEIGNPGEPEGAAGSMFVTVPVIFYGDTKDGQPFRRSADVILRRVNDVPGSTEEQRHWHIQRIDWAA